MSWLVYVGDALRVAPIDRLSGVVALVLAALLLQERAPLSAWPGTCADGHRGRHRRAELMPAG